MSTRKRDRLFEYIRKNLSKGSKSQDYLTILPRLPPELLYEVLDKCDFQTLWNFARASRASYLLCFKVLARKFTFPLSLPQAITSGLLAHHKASGAYDSIKSIALDVSDETWWGPKCKPPRRARQGTPRISPTYLDEIETFLESVKSNNKQCDIKLYSPKGGSYCSITGFSTLYQLIFSTAPRNIDSLTIRISINPYSYFEEELDLIESTIREQVYPDPTWTWNGPLNVGLPMRTLNLEITGQDTHTLSSLPSLLAKTIMASKYAPSNLEELKVILLTRHMRGYFNLVLEGFVFDYLSTPNLKKLHVVDRREATLEQYSKHLALGCPELEELYIDCGLDSEPVDYAQLWRLHKLRILTLPFPGNAYPMLDILNMEATKRRFAFQVAISGSIIRYHGGVIEEVHFVATESEEQETAVVRIY